MADLKVVKKETNRLLEQEQLARLIFEIQRVSIVWNHFAGGIIDGFYPPSVPGQRTPPFNGTDQERIEQLFKIRDYEVRRLADLLRELGVEPAVVNREQFASIYKEMSEATEITTVGHRPL